MYFKRILYFYITTDKFKTYEGKRLVFDRYTFVIIGSTLRTGQNFGDGISDRKKTGNPLSELRWLLRKKLSVPLSEVMVLAKGAMGEEPAYPHLELLEKGTDWFDEIFRLDSVRNYQIGLSGGAENVSYNLSVGFFQ